MLWRVLVLQAEPQENQVMGEFYSLGAGIGTTVMMIGMLAFWWMPASGALWMAEGFAKVTLGLASAFGVFTLILALECAERAEHREEARERLRKRRERQAEEMYWREVDPRGRKWAA